MSRRQGALLMVRCGTAALVAVSWLVLSIPVTTTLSAQQPRPAKPQDFRPFQPAAGRFAVEYPKRDWITAPGAGALLVVFSQTREEAAVGVEYAALNRELAPEEISQQLADLEVEHAGQRDTKAEGFRTVLRADAGGRRVIALEFTRTGNRGIERVRQYTLPLGTDLFRIICSASPQLFDKYSPIFDYMAETFKKGPGVASPQK